MDAELLTIFQNINSLVEQAKQMLGSGGAAPTEGEASPGVAEKIMKFLKEMDSPTEDKKPEEEDKGKSVEKTDEVEKADQPALSAQDEGTTASDKAKTIIDEQGEVNEKNINEVAKTIIKMLSDKKVQKSENKNELFDVIKVMAEKQNEIEKALGNIFEGLGIADQIKKLEVKKQEDVRRPENDKNEIQKSLDYIKQQLGVPVQDNRPVGNTSESVHKSLTDALSNIVQGK
jgi:hypothetical protein